MLKVLVKGATNLPDVDRLSGKSDPYAVLSFRGLEKKTDTIKDDLNPVWNKDLLFDLNGRALTQDDELVVTIKDWEKVLNHRRLGSVNIPLKALIKSKSPKQDKDLVLLDASQRPTKGNVQLTIEYDAPPEPDKEEEEDEEELEEEEEEEGTGDGAKPRGKRSKKRRKRRQLSDKVQDFQIRIKVFEARQLSGNNIHPLVQVCVSDQEQATQAKKSTNRPTYNKSFTFNFHASPAELFDDYIMFEVFDSLKFRVDELLGSFEITIGDIYDMKGHCALRKWMLLTDTKDKENDEEQEEEAKKKKEEEQSKLNIKKKTKKRPRGSGTPAGYLKATITVLGPGDEPPAPSKLAGEDDTDDIEANLLRPSGVDLQPVVFSVKIFNAEDVPQMDSAAMQGIKKFFGFHKSGDKLVDPYAVLTFAGKKVETAIKYKTDHPEFNQIVSVRSRFPSMCDAFKLQLFDWDRLTEDDCIGTTYISIPEISGTGEEGFLPTFGPCFVNFYGSPREFSELPDEFEDLNFGRGEGVAYRGRMMVGINTELGQEIEKEIDNISPQDVIRAQPLLRRCKYKLFACFYEASMVSEVDGPVEFEISIGNYGNMMDESVAPSNTPPCNAVYDGCNYYYLPWSNNKPCVCVESYWEDIAFRLEPLNVLDRIVQRLEKKLQVVREKVAEEEPAKDIATVIFEILDQLIADCTNPLPQPKGRFNQLDRKNAQYRQREMHYIANEATALKEHATDIQTTLNTIQGYVDSLRDLLIEPQNSIPDVIIWMISGSNRIAYHRIPAHEILYSPTEEACGRNCRRTMEILLKYPGKKALDHKEHPELPAVVRLQMWFGREEYQGDWSGRRKADQGEFCIYAETYENEMSVAGIWTKKMLPRPGFSSVNGEVPLPKDKFQAPEGWKFEGEWFKNPELSLALDSDSGHKFFLQDVFENESRMIPGGNWGKASVPWTNVHNDPCDGPETVKCPPGWEWSYDWQIDINRAVDEEGWEYSVDVSYGAYGPIQKAYHLVRRRRLVRNRELKDPNAAVKKAEIAEFAKEGWEYANLFTTRFHAKERKMDFVRRRRWHRKMVMAGSGESPELPPIFQMHVDGEDDAKSCIRNMPRMFVTFKKPRQFQLWVYLYQARDLLSKDESGMNDCYVNVAFGKQSQSTEVLNQTLCPCWDQTLIFDDVEIHESLDEIVAHPPRVILEFFDKDVFGKDDFLGRSSITPIVRLHGHQIPEPSLEWNDIYVGATRQGQVLAVCELFLDEGAELPFTPVQREEVFQVRDGVRPETQRAAIEVLSWGVRNMKKFELSNVTSPCIEFEVGGAVMSSDVIKNTKRNPNFDKPVLPRLIMQLPIKEIYCPPINIRVRDNRTFGRRPIVGVHSIKSLAPYRCAMPVKSTGVAAGIPKKPPRTTSTSSQQSHVVNVTSAGHDHELIKKQKEADAMIDWWSKFYASIGDLDKAGKYLEQGYETMAIYQTELEKIDKYKGFKDFIMTFPLRRGKQKLDDEEDDDEDSKAGEFKGTFRVYPIPPEVPLSSLPDTIFANLPLNRPQECIVRVYLVKALDLQPRDVNGMVDAYPVISIGKQKIDDEDNYISNNLNPEFGRMYELTANIPLAKDLKITIKDRDVMGKDDTIGETVIDLEQRLLSSYRATCGLPKDYFSSGINKWRDCQKPTKILEQWCALHNKPPPTYGTDSIMVDNRTYTIQDLNGLVRDDDVAHRHLGSTNQRLALHVLSQYSLLPEHVETRPLYTSLQPRNEQGRLQMWVDIFPKHLGKPGPKVNISARVPRKHAVRVVIWNTADVFLEETSITGEKMSDIFVKGWLDGIEESQETDVHYRSLNGEGNFNWRLIYPFMYLPYDKKLVVTEKEHLWSISETSKKIVPKLVMQIWDNDIIGSDDFIGSVELDLTRLLKPSKNSRGCKLSTGRDDDDERLDLFSTRITRGWWPVSSTKNGKETLTGKLEMTIEVLTEEEEKARPAGKGREDPNKNPPLPEPNRPATSFLWFTSPFKTLKYIIWKRYKWVILGLLLLIILIIFVVLFIYSAPGYTVKKLMNA